MPEIRKTCAISWIKAALNEFRSFPEGAESVCLAALTTAAEGGKADIAKPLQGLGSGLLKSRCRSRAMLFGSYTRCSWRMKFWVVHAFQKKSTKGIKTPKHEIRSDQEPTEKPEGDVQVKREEKLEVVRGTGNVFRDLGRNNADAEQFKAM